MKILWHSVAPWVGSGYGIQTATFAPRIKALGHDLKISAYYGIMGSTMEWKGIDCLPSYAKAYGTDMVVLHALHHFGVDGGTEVKDFRKYANKGLVITLGDVWTFQAPLLPDMNVASWTPVDHETVPVIVANWFEFSGAVPIAMSRFGEEKLREIGLDPLYVPHGIDTSIFRPGDKVDARERIGIPQDAFVIAMVAANIGRDGSRKAFYEQITAFGALRQKHPDAVLALHTDVVNPYGVDVRHLLSDFPPESYVITDQYAYRVGVPQDTVADLYRAADVLTNCSWGEGFGVPIVEAQACGTPVIVTDTTAMPELCGAGWRVAGEPLWHDSQHAWARKPYIGAIVDAYEQAYDKARDDELRAQAWMFAQAYDADRVLQEYWVPALAKLEDAVERARTAPDKPTKRKVSVFDVDGLLWIDHGKGTGDSLGHASHEEEIWPIIEDLLPKDGVLLDVGAHVGHYALRLASKASMVFAIEANPETAAVLRQNIALNDIDNVLVSQVAAWDECTELKLWDPQDQQAGGSTRTLPADASDVDTVNAMPLDMVVHTDSLDLVKMDVEGADLRALLGMSGLLAQFHPVLFIECHDYCGYYERANLEDLLRELGYTWEVAYTYQSHWRPDGVADEPADADYLICRPVIT